MSAQRKDNGSKPKASTPIAEAAAPAAQPEAERETAAAAPATEVTPAAEEKREPTKALVYVVAPGRSITSPRGIRTAGMVVDPERDHVTDVDALVRIGAVVRA